MDERLTSFKGPIEFSNPTTEELRQFANFLRNLPQGGLGLHATTDAYLPSIERIGLRPEYSALQRVHFSILDTQADTPILYETIVRDIYGKMRNTIADTIEVFGWLKTNKMNNEEPTDRYHPALVVFRDPRTLVAQERKRNTPNPIKRHFAYRNQFYESRLTLMDILAHMPADYTRSLPAGWTERVDREYLVGSYIVAKEDTAEGFTKRVISDLSRLF